MRIEGVWSKGKRKTTVRAKDVPRCLTETLSDMLHRLARDPGKDEASKKHPARSVCSQTAAPALHKAMPATTEPKVYALPVMASPTTMRTDPISAMYRRPRTSCK